MNESNLEQWRNRRHEEALREYNINPKYCKHCGKYIPYEKRMNNYCNSSCFASETNKGICRNKEYYNDLRERGIKLKRNKHKKLDKNEKYKRKLYNSKKYFAHRRISLKKMCVDRKGGKCMICGYDKCLSAMEFHHKDPNIKDFAISKCSISSINKKKIFKEIDKCDLLCANCHREKHEQLKLQKNSGVCMPNLVRQLPKKQS